VRREGIRLIAALLCTVLAVALLNGCGGSDSGGSGDDSAATETSGQAQGEPGDTGEEGGAGGDDAGGASGAASDEDEGRDPADVETPLKVSGGGSEQFRVEGGDNSIQEYGEEADESELEEVAEIVHDFYVARATEDWAGACSYLSESLREQLEQLGSKSEVKECAPFLEAFTTDLPDKVWLEITTIDAASLRHDGEQAFLIYHGAKGEAYAMPLFEEDGEWKVTALSATTIG
jgi:hypothetical protein